MHDARDVKIDLSANTGSQSGPAGDAPRQARPFVSVHFACCNVYLRIYRNAEGTAYHGRCPKCSAPVTFVVGDGGTDARSFVVR